MSESRRVPGLLAIFVGVLVVVQSRINGQLSTDIGDGLLAAVISFGTGLVVVSVLLLVSRANRDAVVHLPSLVRDRKLSWWMLIGGLGGATLVAAQGIAVPMIGVALFTVSLVAGQTANGLFVDHVGLGPRGVAPVTVSRVVGSSLAVVAVVVAVSGRFGSADFVVGLVLLVALAGALIAAQQAVNGRVAAVTGRPIVAGFVNFVVGFSALLVVWLVSGRHGVLLPLVAGKPWLYLGGPIGVIFIVVAAVIVRPLGVLLFGLLSVAGQLGGALFVDRVFPTSGSTLSWQLVAGTILTFVGVAIAGRGSRNPA